MACSTVAVPLRAIDTYPASAVEVAGMLHVGTWFWARLVLGETGSARDRNARGWMRLAGCVLHLHKLIITVLAAKVVKNCWILFKEIEGTRSHLLSGEGKSAFRNI